MGAVEIGLLIIAGIITVGFFANLIFIKTKLPDIIWLLLIGVLLGPVASLYGYELISKDTLVTIAPIFSAIALMIILFDGGLGMNIYKLIKEAPSSFILSILVLVLSTIPVGLIVYWYSLSTGLGLSLLGSMTLGIIVGGTSSAIVVPIIAGMKGVKPKTSLLLSLESIITDPVIIIITLVLIQAMIGGDTSATVFGDIFSSFSISIVLGLTAGLIWTKILSWVQNYDYHHLLTLAFVFIMFSSGELMNASGAIVAFVIGVVLGNNKNLMTMLKIRKLIGLTPQTRKFNSLITFFVRTFFFVFIGTLVTFNNPLLFIMGTGLAFVLLLMRIISIKLLKNRLSNDPRERYIMAYTYPRGLAAAVLAGLPAAAGIPGTTIFNDIVFAVILTTVIVTTFGILRADRKFPIEEIRNKKS